MRWLLAIVLLSAGICGAEEPAESLEPIVMSLKICELDPKHDGAQAQTISSPKLMIMPRQEAQALVGQGVIPPDILEANPDRIETGIRVTVRADSFKDGKTAVDFTLSFSEPVLNEGDELEIHERKIHVVKRYEIDRPHKIRLPSTPQGRLLFAEVTFSRGVQR